MPALANIRHERFVRHWMKYQNGRKAYCAAGYQPSNANVADAAASQLLRRPKVQARIQELRRQMERNTRVTLETLAAELDEARTLAIRTEQPSAAVQASTVKAKLFGHLVDRKEVGKPGEFGDAQSIDDVLAVVRKELGESAADVIAQAIGKDAGDPEPAPSTEPSEPIEPTHDGSGAMN